MIRVKGVQSRCLVGDNVAGVSTVVKDLAVVHQANEGEIVIDGKPAELDNPTDSINYGIATVFQDLALCDNLNVVENLFLGQELSPFRLNESQMELRSFELLDQLTAKIPSLHTPVGALSGGQRQTIAIEIGRAHV